MSENFSFKSVDDSANGPSVYSVVHVGSEGMSGMDTDDSETF
jgi:hypothetical protein